MEKEYNEFKQSIGVRWVKGDSGNTYLCPSALLEKVDPSDEKQLKNICLDESENPQND
jgi:hypothetical protein